MLILLLLSSGFILTSEVESGDAIDIKVYFQSFPRMISFGARFRSRSAPERAYFAEAPLEPKEESEAIEEHIEYPEKYTAYEEDEVGKKEEDKHVEELDVQKTLSETSTNVYFDLQAGEAISWPDTPQANDAGNLGYIEECVWLDERSNPQKVSKKKRPRLKNKKRVERFDKSLKRNHWMMPIRDAFQEMKFGARQYLEFVMKLVIIFIQAMIYTARELFFLRNVDDKAFVDMYLNMSLVRMAVDAFVQPEGGIILSCFVTACATQQLFKGAHWSLYCATGVCSWHMCCVLHRQTVKIIREVHQELDSKNPIEGKKKKKRSKNRA